MTDYEKIRQNAAKLGRDALITVQEGEFASTPDWRTLQAATDAAINFYNAATNDVSAQLTGEMPTMDLRPFKERVMQLLDEVSPGSGMKPASEVLGRLRSRIHAWHDDRLALLELERLQMQKTIEEQGAEREQPDAADEDAAVGDTYTPTVDDWEIVCRRLASVEDALAEHRRRFVAVTDVLSKHDAALLRSDAGKLVIWATKGEVERFEDLKANEDHDLKIETPPLRVGSEVRLDGAITRGGHRLTGWFPVTAIHEEDAESANPFVVQVKDPVAPPNALPAIYNIKRSDILEIR